jgi:hypothetical protein
LWRNHAKRCRDGHNPRRFRSASPAIANLQGTAVYNLVHASDNANDPEEPLREISHCFSEEELVDYFTVDTSAMFKKDPK